MTSAPVTGGRPRLIDCDIHPGLDGIGALFPYLSQRWIRHLETYGAHMRQVFENALSYPRVAKDTARHDAWPPNGKPPGADLDFMRLQHLDAMNVAYGFLQPLRPGVASITDPDLGAALARAVNDWQAEFWMAREPRLRASIVVPHENPTVALAEIERCAANPGFRQIALPPKSIEPLGRRRFWPIYEAAEALGLPICLHVSGVAGHAITGAGWPSYYIEDHNANVAAIQTSLISLIFEGVTRRFPNLRVTLVEGGMAWSLSLGARLDRLADRFRDELPELGDRPSEHVRQSFYFTTQPSEEPPRRQMLVRLMREVGIDRIMFASDYPHWDTDDPDFSVPSLLTAEEREAILYGNAAQLYGLPALQTEPVPCLYK